MPHRKWKYRIRDIVNSIDSIQKYMEGMDYSTFIQDRKTFDAVIRHLSIIGEAARHVPDSIIDKYASLPWLEMQDMRNILVHEYFGIQKKIVWDTIKHNLPTLLLTLRKILQESEEF